MSNAASRDAPPGNCVRNHVSRGLALHVAFRLDSARAVLLTFSNVFMTLAWYAHLRELSTRPWYIAVVISWGIALFEYMLQVPANRIGYRVLSVSQLKIAQEVFTLSVFVPVAVFYMKGSM